MCDRTGKVGCPVGYGKAQHITYIANIVNSPV